MEQTLDLSRDDHERLIAATVESILAQYDDVNSVKGYHDYPQSEVESWFDEELPAEGIAFDDLMAVIQKRVVDTATGNFGPHMYAYVMAGGNPISALADYISATVNQNLAKWHLSPSMTEIEKRVINWAGEIIGYSADPGGVMVSGGSEANMVGLTVARNVFFEKMNVAQNGLFGMQPFAIYCSEETHSCIDKSAVILGIGRKHIRKIPTDAEYRIDTDALVERIEQDVADGITPFCLVGNAGTVNTGAIDDLSTLADIAEKYSMWYHIDGAYGGLASALPGLREYYRGIDRADSVALDFHKWLYQPYEAGCALVRNWSLLRQTYFKQADYLDTSNADPRRTELNEHMFQLSRNTRAFKVWMSVKYYGFDAIRDMIQKDIDLTHYLSQLVTDADDFELSATSHLAVTCFRYIGQDMTEEQIEETNSKLIPALEADGRVFIMSTKLRGQLVIRACLINHRKTKETTSYLLDVIRDVANGL